MSAMTAETPTQPDSLERLRDRAGVDLAERRRLLGDEFHAGLLGRHQLLEGGAAGHIGALANIHKIGFWTNNQRFKS